MDSGPARLGRNDVLAALGLYLLTVSVYLLSGPGRIDMIDGQYRFEVARSLLDVGQPVLRDGRLPGDFAVQGLRGVVTGYGATVSVLALPLLALGRALGMVSQDAQQTVFSWLSGLLGALVVPVQVGVHRWLGVPLRSAVGWALVTAFCTQLWITSTTSFDQSMHAAWILLAVGCTWRAGQTGSMGTAAVAGGAMALLVNHQEVYAALLPFVLLSLLPPPGERFDRRRAAVAGVVVLGLLLGFMAWAGWNVWRLGAPLRSGKVQGAVEVAPHPVAAGLTLLLSPGKGVLWYSPPVVLGLAGMAGLWRRARGLAAGVVATSLALLGLYMLVPFFSGDWCWGPRYMLPVLVLVGLGMPLLRPLRSARRLALAAVVVAGLGVQLLALSLDHHRFFQDRGLVGAVVDQQPDYYWTHSALWARPEEIRQSLEGLPDEVERFACNPYQDHLTYMTWGLAPPNGAELQRKYAVFWLPRPWPLWMAWLQPGVPSPIPVVKVELALAALALVGAGLLARALGTRPAPRPG